MIIKKTQQPTDVDLAKLRYPVGASIKYDGVKACRFNNQLRGRSFKNYRNEYLNLVYDYYEYSGFEGEIVVGTDLFADDLCRKTTSAVNSILGQPAYGWLVFDYVTDETINLSYTDRLVKLKEHIAAIAFTLPEGCYIKVVDVVEINNEEELLAFEAEVLSLGGEGIIIRDLNSKYKQGRVTVNSQECLRLKRYMDEEGIVLEVIEGNTNNNEAEINELGNTFRSSHKENLSPNGMVGSLIVKSIATGQIDTISAGKMTHDERKFYFLNQNEIIGSIIKYKHFATGVKVKKRFPRFIGFRLAEDMDNV